MEREGRNYKCIPLPKTRTQPGKEMVAVYLGVEGYGTVTAEQKDFFEHRFSICGQTKRFRISSAGDYAVQNCLEEGGLYRMIEKDGVVTEAAPERGIPGHVDAVERGRIWVGNREFFTGQGTYTAEILTAAGGASVNPRAVQTGDEVRILTDRRGTVRQIYLTASPEQVQPPVQGLPGKRTLKNFLSTALMPVGTVLYVFGGGWNWQDTGSGCQARSIGLAQSWVRFFQSQDTEYTYKNSDPAHSYYPFCGWNQYYYAGLDCSGYVGWVVYNTLNRESGLNGWVMSAKKMARTFAEQGLGTWTQTEPGFRPGDVFSMDGHVWICLGTCSDGSVVILHATPSESRSGYPGGGVQLSALNPTGGLDCEAFRLANYVMTRCYPKWSTRYKAVTRNYQEYALPASSGPAAEWSGRFRWNLDGRVLTDPEGYAALSAREILGGLFGMDIFQEE